MRLAQSCSSQDRACEKSWIQTSLRGVRAEGLGLDLGSFLLSLHVTSQDNTWLQPPFLVSSCRNFSP